jgi:hypothetical protein
MRGREWLGENSPKVRTIERTRDDVTDTENAKKKRREDTAVHSLVAREKWGEVQ